ncbi:MAG TPA: Rieske 2Fe-2S domain-containing protein [Blastocatellia bacterium]
MDTVQDSEKRPDSQKVESEDTPKVAASVEEKQKAASKVEVKPKAAPPAQKASASTADKPPAKVAAKPAVGSSAGAKTKTVTSEPPPDPVNKMRRTIVWTSVGAFLATSFMMFLRFFLPRTIFEPSTVFRVGYPSDFGFGVDTKFQQQYRIWVVRNAERLFVIYARCTHLGCTPDWKPSENKFKCPCHGSGYTSEGINFEGPAPRPMDRARVELDPTGQIVVDTSILYQWPKGEDTQFNKDGSYIPV